MKKKQLLSIVLSVFLLTALLPTTAFAATVSDNPAGNTLGELPSSDVMINNYGTINANLGTVTNNFGTVTSNTGTVTNNFGAATVGGTAPQHQFWAVTVIGGEHTGNDLTAANGKLWIKQRGLAYFRPNDGYSIFAATATKGTIRDDGSGFWTLTGVYEDTTVALTVYKADNPAGNSLSELPSGETMNENKGNVTYNNGTLNTNSGSVTNNDGTLNTNSGSVTYNSGTVGTNNGDVNTNYNTVTSNTGTVTDNSGTVTSNTNTVTDNFGTVTNNTGTVTNNFGTVTNNAGTVVNNFGTATVGGSAPQHQFWQVTVIGGEHTGNNLTATNGFLWIKQGGSTEFSAKAGYTIFNATAGNGTISDDGSGKWTLTGVTEDTTVALTVYKADNPAGNTLAELPSGETMNENKGDITDNNGTLNTNSGSVTNNNGTVGTNNGDVNNNTGTVSNNADTVTNNTGSVTNNTGTVTNNTGTVTANTGTLTNNFGTVTGNTGTVVNNFGTATVGGTPAQHQFWEVTVTGGEHATSAGLTAGNGKSWIENSAGSVVFSPAAGYSITAATATNGTITSASGKWTLTGVTAATTVKLTVATVPKTGVNRDTGLLITLALISGAVLVTALPKKKVKT